MSPDIKIGTVVVFKTRGVGIHQDGKPIIEAGKYTITGFTEDCRSNGCGHKCTGALVLNNGIRCCYKFGNTIKHRVFEFHKPEPDTEPTDINIHRAI